jgi:hypothetical protein
MLVTNVGGLIPAFTETNRRKNKYSVEFYKEGMIKAVALDEMQEIITPIGEFPAELVTFFETGELKRFFPLDGKISGMWTEEEEKALGIPLSFALPFTSFTAIISGIAFYKTGDIRSITLFPGETVSIKTKYGEITARNGFSLYESGRLESLEPSLPVKIKTPIGALHAYDPNAIGINADINSLVFNEDGSLASLTTFVNSIAAGESRSITFVPRVVVNPLDDETMITIGLKISFDYKDNTVTIDDGEKETTLPVSGSGFTITTHVGPENNMCDPFKCASCSLCG